MAEKELLIVLSRLKFPEHWKAQDWLNKTEYGEEFELVLTTIDIGKTLSQTVPALKPKTEKSVFYWSLRGDKGAKELEEKVLDFADNITYNT